MTAEFTPIDAGQTFAFACGPQVGCFNECCRDLNQFLYPYDILRLCRCLEWPSERFLAHYTRTHDGPMTGLPVVSLRFDPARDGTCPFVTASGCRVYPDRPAACRLYPLARAIRRTCPHAPLTEHFALLREPHCQGHEAALKQGVRDWIETQGLADYHRLNDPMVSLIGLKRRRHPAPLPPSIQARVHTALYDADRFRRHLLSHPQDDPLAPSGLERQALAEDDEALIRFAYRWVAALIEVLTPGAPG
jgi:Fe-S-cluster containining protein